MQKIEQNKTNTNRRYNREYKVIDPARVLDLSVTGIAPLADDEVFVESGDFKSHYISCYGRLMKLINEEYRLMNQYIDEAHGGKPFYSLCGTNRTAASLVVDEFIDNPYGDTQTFVWYHDGDFTNTYYKNLFPLSPHYYSAVKVYTKTHDFLTKDIILDIMNEDIYVPTVFGVGYWGCTDVDTTSDPYLRWVRMLERVFYPRYHLIRPAYRMAEVCEEWRCFKNFRDWYEKNFYQIPGERMHLDKDIMGRYSNIYSPETARFVPQSINTMFSRRVDQTNPLPTGVWVDKKSGRYRITFNRGKGEKEVNTFATVEEAFARYKELKEKAIKELAEKYKEYLPLDVYETMMAWEVRITD